MKPTGKFHIIFWIFLFGNIDPSYWGERLHTRPELRVLPYKVFIAIHITADNIYSLALGLIDYTVDITSVFVDKRLSLIGCVLN